MLPMSAKLESHHQNGIKTVIIDADWLKTPLKEPRTVPGASRTGAWEVEKNDVGKEIGCRHPPSPIPSPAALESRLEVRW
ncbi:hypothetical protein QR685DRAFT_436348 [Neurospora intermedia]|uniref:Uncharacterized protein n=1 Tax=Neurospora intermedia TaxID=5142 RepID=A0ABR3DLN0_NEUIN